MSADSSPPTAKMVKVKSARASTLLANLESVQSHIKAASNSRSVRLVLVSKLKPASDILALHQAPASQLHFGENYQQELTQKAELLPRSIRWHFIGGLQTNKCKPLAESVRNLWCVSSVDTIKKADALEKGRAALASKLESEGDKLDSPLRVQVQVNTSGESEKSGCEPQEAAELVRHIREQCPHLLASGFMTIGAIARSKATGDGAENEDFKCLIHVRDKVCKELNIQKADLELSMGMSNDFKGAIQMGSDEVRIGSTLFGERPPKNEAKIIESDDEK